MKRKERKSEGREKRILWQGKGWGGSGGGEGVGGGEGGVESRMVQTRPSRSLHNIRWLGKCLPDYPFRVVGFTIHFTYVGKIRNDIRTIFLSTGVFVHHIVCMRSYVLIAYFGR